MFSCQTIFVINKHIILKVDWKKLTVSIFISTYIFIEHWVRILLRTINTSGFHEKISCTVRQTSPKECADDTDHEATCISHVYIHAMKRISVRSCCDGVEQKPATPRVPSASVNITYHRRAAHSITVWGLILFTYKLNQGTYIYAYIWKIR